jgi:hypothetical protein
MPGAAPLDCPAFPDEFLDECRSLVRRRTVPDGQRIEDVGEPSLLVAGRSGVAIPDEPFPV